MWEDAGASHAAPTLEDAHSVTVLLSPGTAAAVCWSSPAIIERRTGKKTAVFLSLILNNQIQQYELYVKHSKVYLHKYRSSSVYRHLTRVYTEGNGPGLQEWAASLSHAVTLCSRIGAPGSSSSSTSCQSDRRAAYSRQRMGRLYPIDQWVKKRADFYVISQLVRTFDFFLGGG